jgi:FKBP-type peptidyl-prolyl cis-trans isomerase SlyD
MVPSTKPKAVELRDAFRVGPGMHVQLDYRVSDAEGEAVGPDAERLVIIFGTGQLIPAVEQAIDGLGVGETKQITLRMGDAYGPRNPDAILEVDRSEFPPDVEPGDFFEVENADQGVLVLRILEVGDDFVVVDMNHPLAGQDLDVVMTILDVRPATQDELDLAIKVGIAEESRADSPLISPDSLLRGRRRR